jgi:SAM-dependent methyltransferase
MTGSVQPAAGGGPDAATVYALGTSKGETDRLLRQPDELAAYTAMLLDRVGLRPGHSVIDLGCGPRGILDLLAERVLPGGRVAGLDADPAHTAMAAEFAAGRGLAGVEIVTADARRTGLPSSSFDLVHARTLLVNIPDPPQVVAEMVRLARPGGWVAAMEADTEHTMCYPLHPAVTRASDIFEVVFRRDGADPRLGRRVPELFRQAGLADVGVEARVQLYPPGHSGGQSWLTWCAACAGPCWRWGWQARPSWMNWTPPPAPTWKIHARWRHSAFSTWSGAASRLRHRPANPHSQPEHHGPGTATCPVSSKSALSQ